jgi:two-component system, chemotaxis family, protein-glutamate methylesterase/glutaminase
MVRGTKQLVVIGTSAGGIEALRILTAALPANFPAPICIVVHVAPQSPRLVHEILNRSGALPASSPRNGERLQGGRIYVAPPDHHLVVEPGCLRTTKGPRENRFRPAIDPLFRSAAQVYGPAAIGVILTGNLDDGAAGLWAIKRLGGIAVVQHPDDAMFPSMPHHALERVKADHVVSLVEIAPLLERLTVRERPESGEFVVPEHVNVEVNIAKEQHPLDAGLERIAKPSRFACPECHGVLLQLQEDGRVRFRCHTGHAYSIDSLLSAIGEGIDEAIWNAIRAVDESGLYMQMIADHLRTEHGDAATQLEARIREARAQSDTLRTLAQGREPLMTK